MATDARSAERNKINQLLSTYAGYAKEASGYTKKLDELLKRARNVYEQKILTQFRSKVQEVINDINLIVIGYDEDAKSDRNGNLTSGFLQGNVSVAEKTLKRIKITVGSLEAGVNRAENTARKSSNVSRKGTSSSTRLRHDEDSEAVIQHYGVLGMKWGVRKDPEKAYSKSSNKLRKLDNKLLKKTAKSNKAEQKMTKAKAKATSLRKMKKANKLEVKYNKMMLKTNKSRKKAIDWYDKMFDTFSGMDLKNVSAADVELGESYRQMLFSEVRMRGGAK